MKLNIIFFLKGASIFEDNKQYFQENIKTMCVVFFPNKQTAQITTENNFLKKQIFKKALLLLKKTPPQVGFFFLNRFILLFLENFFKSKVILNIKKSDNKILLKQISTQFFHNRFFKKNLGVSKQIIGVLYYSILLKDATIFSNFFKKIFEKINIKLHKKLLWGLKKLIKDIFRPLFGYMGLLGLFLNIKGKLGVSGSAKKRRYYFCFGKHSITKRTLRVSHKQVPVWTFTGTLGLGFFLFF